MMKILLVAVNAKYIHSNPAVFSLKACAGTYQSYVDVLEFTINQPPSFLLREIYKKHPDVIAFSCYIWNRTIIEQVIKDLRKILPDTDLWAGGPEVSFQAHSIIRLWGLRGVMAGPGENAFCHLAASYVNGTADRLPAVLDQHTIPVRPLDEIPFWYDNMENFSHRIVYYESSRGCPFSCSYCLSSIDRTMDFRSVSRVCRELDFFLEQKTAQVKFVDRTFNCKKEHALPILSHILAHDNGITNFHFEITADLLDEDYFALLAQMRPGAVQLEIGVQSTCARTLDEIRRKMDFEKTAAAVRRICSRHNIHVHLDLIAGLPFEDLLTFQTSFNDVYALCPHQLQLGFLKVLSGSGMERHAGTYSLLYTAQPPYEVLSTKWLSYDQICRLKQIEEVLELYYNSGQFAHTLTFLCTFFATAYDMYDSLACWFESHRLCAVQSSRVRKYEILLEFGCGRISRMALDTAPDRQICMLKEYLAYDFYLREHVRNRPDFALPMDCWKDTIKNHLIEEAKTHTLFPILDGCSYRELTKALHPEVFRSIFEQPVLVFFCYEKRDPLTRNAMIQKIRLPDHSAPAE
ncbi:MAG: B12-binding domain-containing radical SAM protein [Eubacterium sp.]|nr:B12-binding domain-containing radical SAM protein [Eubacterium sp.]